MNYRYLDRVNGILALRTMKVNGIGINNSETYNVYQAIKQTNKIDGDIAEVGVYKGGSAELICIAKGRRKLYLFDTFEGLPEFSKYDKTVGDPEFKPGGYCSDYRFVKERLKKYPTVYIYKGLFPKTAEPIAFKKFCFVHLDVDLYMSTKEALKFFYPRMQKGGIIISHNYSNYDGVMKAFDDFFKDKPEPIIELKNGGTQCMMVKV